MNNLIGQQLGPYRIIEEIGRGGMSVVYKAWDTVHNRHVALKVLPPYFQHDTEFLRRFLEEARRTVPLRYPHIVETYEAGQADGYYYIAMEYMAGSSLAVRLRKQTRLGLEEAVTVLSQVAAALDHAHNQGIIHRDVKPSNILFDQSGQAKLADFGIAKAADQATVTLPGTLVGTPEYMSPEQAQGRPVDERTDVWSLGVVLYQMLTGRLPFVGDNPHAVLYQVVRQQPRPATSVNHTLPRPVDTILGKALEKSPRRRYRRAGEMAGDLRQLVHRPGETPTVFKKEAEPPTKKLALEALPKASSLPVVPIALFGGLGAVVLILLLVLSLRPGPTGPFAFAPTQTAAPATLPRPTVPTVTQTPGVSTPTSTVVSPPTPTPLMLRFEQAGILQNTEAGFNLDFVNILTPVTVKRVMGFAVDGEAVPLEEIHIRTPGAEEVTAAHISSESWLHIGQGVPVTIHVIRKPLSLGAHEIKLVMLTEEMGYLQIALSGTIEFTPPPPVTATSTVKLSPTPEVTRTPTAVLPTVTATPPAAITLIEPANGAEVQDRVTFRWQWAVPLQGDETFDVRVCRGTGCQPQFGKTNEGKNIWEWCPDWVWALPPDRKDSIGPGDVLRWQVLLIDGRSKQPKGPTSEVWSFEWGGGPCTKPPTGEAPTPIPTPR